MIETDLKRLLAKKVNVLNTLLKRELNEGSSQIIRMRTFTEIKGHLYNVARYPKFSKSANEIIRILSSLEKNHALSLQIAIEPLVKLVQILPENLYYNKAA